MIDDRGQIVRNPYQRLLEENGCAVETTLSLRDVDELVAQFHAAGVECVAPRRKSFNTWQIVYISLNALASAPAAVVAQIIIEWLKKKREEAKDITPQASLRTAADETVFSITGAEDDFPMLTKAIVKAIAAQQARAAGGKEKSNGRSKKRKA